MIICQERKKIINNELTVPFDPVPTGLNLLGDIIESITPDSPSDKIGILVGWRILNVDGIPQKNDKTFVEDSLDRAVQKGKKFKIIFEKVLCVEKLDKYDRLAIHMLLVEKMSVAEMADRLNKPDMLIQSFVDQLLIHFLSREKRDIQYIATAINQSEEFIKVYLKNKANDEILI